MVKRNPTYIFSDFHKSNLLWGIHFSFHVNVDSRLRGNDVNNYSTFTLCLFTTSTSKGSVAVIPAGGVASGPT